MKMLGTKGRLALQARVLSALYLIPYGTYLGDYVSSGPAEFCPTGRAPRCNSLTATPLEFSSSEWFDPSVGTAATEDLPPSLAQHASWLLRLFNLFVP